MVEREFYEGNAAAQKRSRNPAGVVMAMLLGHLELNAGLPKVFADGTRSVAPTEQGLIRRAGGKGSIVAAAIVAVLAGLCRPRGPTGRLHRRPNFEGTDPEIVARLAESALELGCPATARVLSCSADAARDGVRLAAQYTATVVAGTRHAPARVRLGECFDRAVVYVETEAPLHWSAKPDASYFEPTSYASLFESKSKARVNGHVAPATAPDSATCRTVSGSARTPRRSTSKPVQRATSLTLGGPAPAQGQPLTMSAFCLAARSLGKAAAIAAVLILDHQRATGGLWVDNVAPAPGQKPETGKARRLLEAFNRHHGGRAPRARDVETAARGLVSLASAGLLCGRLWALSPELALYGIEPAPSSEPMPTGPEVNDLVRWLRGVSPASEKQLSFLGKHGIDGAGMSSAEAAALQVKLHGRWTSSRRHDVLAWIADRLCPDLRASCLKGHIPRADRLQLQHLWSLDGSALKLRQDELNAREAQHRAHYEARQAAARAKSSRELERIIEDHEREQFELIAAAAEAAEVEPDRDGVVSEDEADALFRWAELDEASSPAANQGEDADCPPIDWLSMLDEADMATIVVDADADADDMAPARAAGGAW